MPDALIRVERVAIRGVAEFDGERFGAALEGELGRLLTAGFPTPVEGYTPAVTLRLPNGAVDSAALGVQVAQAIYSQMHGGGA